MANATEKDWGLSREEVWQAVAREIGGTYYRGDFWEKESLQAVIPPWRVTLDLVTESARMPVTRLRTRYRMSNGFAFTLFRQKAFQDVGPLRRMPEILVGDTAFDAEFRIAATDRDQLLRLLSRSHISEYLRAETHIGLEVTPLTGWPQIGELTCSVLGTVQERSRLVALFELMGDTLQTLVAIGAATETDPLQS